MAGDNGWKMLGSDGSVQGPVPKEAFRRKSALRIVASVIDDSFTKLQAKFSTKEYDEVAAAEELRGADVVAFGNMPPEHPMRNPNAFNTAAKLSAPYRV